MQRIKLDWYNFFSVEFMQIPPGHPASFLGKVLIKQVFNTHFCNLTDFG